MFRSSIVACLAVVFVALLSTTPVPAKPIPTSMLLDLQTIANDGSLNADEAAHRASCDLGPAPFAFEGPSVGLVPMSGAACTAQCRVDYGICLDGCDAAPFPGCYDHCRFDVLYACYRKCLGAGR